MQHAFILCVTLSMNPTALFTCYDFNMHAKDALKGTTTIHNIMVWHPFNKRMRRNAVFMHWN